MIAMGAIVTPIFRRASESWRSFHRRVGARDLFGAESPPPAISTNDLVDIGNKLS
jgi:hypothetical protein